MKLSQLLLVSAVVLSPKLFAENFEIVDGTANISGKPNISQAQARENYDAACDKWKKETKELNQGTNQVMALICETPTCSENEGIVTCSGTASYRLKTAGTRVQPQPVMVAQQEPAPAPVVTQTVVETAPPPVIVETIPAPRPGFIWIRGYWGWHNHRHHWYGGHWWRR